jgi:excisionase family DNA binding protein
MPDEWLTTGQAAEMLGVSRSTVVRYIEAGTLEARRLPSGHWRIHRTAAEKLLRSESDHASHS